MRILILLVATALTVLFVIQERRGSEAAYLYENLDVGKFPVFMLSDMLGVIKDRFV